MGGPPPNRSPSSSSSSSPPNSDIDLALGLVFVGSTLVTGSSFYRENKQKKHEACYKEIWFRTITQDSSSSSQWSGFLIDCSVDQYLGFSEVQIKKNFERKIENISLSKC